jgi:hypothetical protein
MKEDARESLKIALFLSADILHDLHARGIIDGGLILLLPWDGDATEVGIAGYAPEREDGQPVGQIYHEILAALVWTLLTSGIQPASIMEATERAIRFYPQLTPNTIAPLDGLGELN